MTYFCVTFDTIITTSEKEALLLENNLIKKYNPKFNILLKDDKRYPYVKLVKKPYPYLDKISTFSIVKFSGLDSIVNS